MEIYRINNINPKEMYELKLFILAKLSNKLSLEQYTGIPATLEEAEMLSEQLIVLFHELYHILEKYDNTNLLTFRNKYETDIELTKDPMYQMHIGIVISTHLINLAHAKMIATESSNITDIIMEYTNRKGTTSYRIGIKILFVDLFHKFCLSYKPKYTNYYTEDLGIIWG